MPRSPSRTSKKKKYNARFPPARIKKIMQTDEDVGKVAAAVPVIISRALELFIESLISETAKTTVARNAKTLSSSHIKQTIESNKQFDFLRDLVANVPDHQTEDNSTDIPEGEATSKKGRGRPRKVKDGCGSWKSKGEPSKALSDTSEEEDEEEDDDEDTETDEENSVGQSSSSGTASIVKNSDRVNHVPGSIAPNAFMNNALNTNSGCPPYFTNPALSSLQNQQQLLQPHEQFQQQRQPGSTLPFPYSPFVGTPPVGMANYPLPFQYSSSSLPAQPPPPPQHSQQPQQQNGQQQQQPMNLSFSSRAMATTARENDDYDT